MERRELLYTVVRDAMVRAGVLSASYKFKVLSLDQRGRQFLVMMDLAREYGGETARLSEIEALIAQTPRPAMTFWSPRSIGASMTMWPWVCRKGHHPHDGAVCCRATRGRSQAGASARPSSTRTGGRASIVAAVSGRALPVSPPRPRRLAVRPRAPLRPHRCCPRPTPVLLLWRRQCPARFEPIEADEVAAFKRALADAAGRAQRLRCAPWCGRALRPLAASVPFH